MLGDISPQTVRITQQVVVYPGRDHVVELRVERFDGRKYAPVDMTAVTRVILSFPDADPVIVYDSAVQAVFTHVGSTLTVDLSDYSMPASVLDCQIILFDAQHTAGQVLVDDNDTVVQFDFRNVSTTGGTPAPAVEYLTDAPVDGVTYARKDELWVPVDALVSGVASVNGQTGVVVLDAADVGADAAGAGVSAAAAAVAAHTALADPHPQYLTPAEGNAAYDALGAAAAAVSAHEADTTPHAFVQNMSKAGFNLTAAQTAGVGEMVWNATDATMDLGLPGGVTLQAGQEFLLRGLNNSGATMADTTVVYISGAQGNRTVFSKAQANLATADKTIGVLTQDITNNQEGFATLAGLVRGIDTSAWAEGSELWLSAATAGLLTNIKPPAPNNAVSLGYVVRSHASLGSIYVRVAVRESIRELHDVVITAPTDGQVLVYDAATSTWVNEAGGGGSGEVNTASNLGTGSGLFAGKVGVDLQFKSLKAGAGVTLSSTATEVTIVASGAGGAVDSVNGKTGVVVLDTDDIAEGVSKLYFTNGRAAAAAPVQTVDGQTGAVSLSSSYAPLSHVGDGGAAHSNAVAAGAAGFMTGADKTKLDGIATGATQNSSDAFLRARGNHTGTQTASTISDFTEATQDVVGSSVVAGANVTVTYDDSTGLTTVAASSGTSLPVVRAITANETLALANINSFGVNSTTSNYTSTIPAQAAVAWTADAELHFLPSNTGDITVTAAAGVSLNGVVAGSLTLSTTNGAATLKRTGADSWWLGGVIGTAADQRDGLGLGSADSPSFAGLSITGGALALAGAGRRITGDFSSGLGSFGNRTIFQSSTVNGQTVLTVIPNGTSAAAGFQIYSNAADQENSTRAAVNLLGVSGLFVSSDRTGSGAYVPVVLSTGGADRLTISTAGTITTPGVYASTTASAANVFVDATGLLQRSTSSEQYKRDIEPMSLDYAERAYQLEPIWYRSKCENDSQDWSWWGFSAEQAAKVDPRLVHWRTTEPVEVDGPIDEQTGIHRKVIEHRSLDFPVAEGFAYERLTVHHNALLTAQRDRIASLEAALEQLTGKVAVIEALL